MVGNNMVEVEGMDTVEEHFHLINHRLKVEGMHTVEEHFHPMNHRPKVEGMDTVDNDMWEDRAVELEVVGREPDGVVLVRHWTGDRAVRHRRSRWEWEELVKLGYSKDQPIFTSQDSNYNST
jgi:hypothetical protein